MTKVIEKNPPSCPRLKYATWLDPSSFAILDNCYSSVTALLSTMNSTLDGNVVTATVTSVKDFLVFGELVQESENGSKLASKGCTGRTFRR